MTEEVGVSLLMVLVVEVVLADKPRDRQTQGLRAVMIINGVLTRWPVSVVEEQSRLEEVAELETLTCRCDAVTDPRVAF